MLDRTIEMNTEIEIELTAGGLREALRRVRHAMCREETRYYLDGVYLHHVAKIGALRFVATDGNRLATADIGTAEGSETIRPVILSRAFVTEAIKGTSKRRDAFRHVRLAIGADYARLSYWDGTASDGPLVDGTFPEYERVIPRGEPQHGTATIVREPFLRAVAGLTEFAKASGRKWPAKSDPAVCVCRRQADPVCRHGRFRLGMSWLGLGRSRCCHKHHERARHRRVLWPAHSRHPQFVTGTACSIRVF